MSGELCKHLLTRSSCAQCMITVVPDERQPPGTFTLRNGYDWAALWELAFPPAGLYPWISSRYGGRCRGCGERFEPGDLIRYDEAEAGYLAGCCGDSPDD